MYFRRSFATLSSLNYTRSAKQVPAAPPLVKQISRLPCGLSIATLENAGPVSCVQVILKAGSRHELSSAPGTAHFLKSTLIRVGFFPFFSLVLYINLYINI
jgi:hypothetical protein